MPFKKGHQKFAGRKRNGLNRTTEQVRQSLLKLLDDNLAKLQQDIDNMNSRDRAYLLIGLAKHVTPPALNPEKLTEEQLLQIIEYLKKSETKS